MLLTSKSRAVRRVTRMYVARLQNKVNMHDRHSGEPVTTQPAYGDDSASGQDLPIHAISRRRWLGQPAMSEPKSITPPPNQSHHTRGSTTTLRLAIFASGST